MKRPMLVVRNLLLSDSGETLLYRREDTGLWEFPGGKVDDETVEAAARREMEEETGLEVLGQPVMLGWVDSRGMKEKSGKRFVELFYHWLGWKGFARRMEPKSHREFGWFHVRELPGPLMPASRKFAEERLPVYLSATNVLDGGETA